MRQNSEPGLPRPPHLRGGDQSNVGCRAAAVGYLVEVTARPIDKLVRLACLNPCAG